MKFIGMMTLLVAVALTGCSGVWLNAEYSTLLDQTAALSVETAERATEGTLSEDEKTAALVSQAEVWQLFRAARDGKAGE